jgi:NAD(P)-dependent dehydrogenase (short-subunit alcohol dehydrogenase family)
MWDSNRMTKILAGKVAIVTGAGAQRGIGRATALKLASLGADVVVTDLSLANGLQTLADEIVAAGGGALAVVADVADIAQIQACAETACERFGGIDILVNNAGTTTGAKPFLEISDADWDQSYAVNLRGPAQFCRAVIPVMIQRGGGVIVNNASLAGLGAEAGFGAYSASKHGLVALTKTIAAEFGSQGIRCNVVCPGFVNTDMHMGVNERLAREAGIDLAEIAQRRYLGVAMGRAGAPAEIAEAIRFSRQPCVCLHHRRGTSRRGWHLGGAIASRILAPLQ